MKYKKTQPVISYQDFYNLAESATSFKSLTGEFYDVISIDDSTMNFVRKSSGEQWKMDLKGVHQAYLELNDFQTANFNPYVPRTHSPALGLLLYLGLLTNVD
ncbi:hypothetical protein SAMN05661099_1192 [Daejeonella lutea]|uniref:Uncharacterized protein n=2 Tax=Daejeonella lutea TaxID=572036 RepID=A0A1T5B1B4_9SPHI|nr:hypothetical protein SAMN05661099_1192 [Daejeonella lutea]